MTALYWKSQASVILSVEIGDEAWSQYADIRKEEKRWHKMKDVRAAGTTQLCENHASAPTEQRYTVTVLSTEIRTTLGIWEKALRSSSRSALARTVRICPESENQKYRRKLHVNRVFYKGGTKPLTPEQLAKEANALYKGKTIFSPADFIGEGSRIAGSNMCYCDDNGEFELLPLNDPVVAEGQKRYMICRKCGAVEHL